METIPVFYDLRESPPTHDFINWLVRAEHWRRLHKASDLQVVIYRGSRQRSNRDFAYSAERRERKIYDLLVPLARLLPCVKDVFVTDPDEIGKQQFSYLNLEQIVPPTLKAPLIAHSIVGNFLKDRRKLVTITIRDSDFESNRNSNLQQWIVVASWLSEKGYDVVWVPDAEAIMNGITYSHILLYHAAAFCPDIRLALYEQAVCNLITTGGPMLMLLHSEAPMMAFKMLVDGIKCCSEKYMRPSKMTPDDIWADNKRFFWKDDKADLIIPELEKFLPTLEKLHKPKEKADVFKLRYDYQKL